MAERELNNSTNLTVGPVGGLDILVGNATYTENWTETKALYVNQEMVQSDSVDHNPVIEDLNSIVVMPYVGISAGLGYGKHLGLEGTLQVGKVMSVGNDLPADAGVEVGASVVLEYRFQ